MTKKPDKITQAARDYVAERRQQTERQMKSRQHVDARLGNPGDPDGGPFGRISQHLPSANIVDQIRARLRG